MHWDRFHSWKSFGIEGLRMGQKELSHSQTISERVVSFAQADSLSILELGHKIPFVLSHI